MTERMTTTPAPTSVRAAAVRYTNRGWTIIPLHGIKNGACTCNNPNCNAPGKHSVGATWQRITDPEHAAAYYDAHPDHNIGVIAGPSGLVIVDLDGPEATSRFLGRVDARQLAGALAVDTARGTHLYFADPEAKYGPMVGKDDDAKIDVRGGTSYVVAPPSIHASGHTYQWRGDVGTYAERGDPRPVPLTLRTYLDERKKQTERKAPLADDQRIAEGSRHPTLVSLAGTMRARGMTAVEIAAALLAVNEARCTPPMDDRDVARIAQSVAQYDPVAVTDPVVLLGEVIKKKHDAEDDAERAALANTIVKKITRSTRAPGRLPGVYGARITRGEPAIVAGWPGQGKSIWWASLAAELTHHGETVAYIATEDDHESVITPRLEAAGAVIDRIVPLEREDGAPLNLAKDGAAILAAIEEHKCCALIVDPIGSVLGSTDLRKPELVRELLYTFCAALTERRCSLIGIAHFNSSEGSSWTTRIGGSSVFGQRARSVLLFGKTPDQDDPTDPIRYLTHAKDNYGKQYETIRLEIVPAFVKIDDEHYQVARAANPTLDQTVTDRDILKRPSTRDEQRREARATILKLLSEHGSMSKGVLFPEVREIVGCSERTVQRACVDLIRADRVIEVGTSLCLNAARA